MFQTLKWKTSVQSLHNIIDLTDYNKYNFIEASNIIEEVVQGTSPNVYKKDNRKIYQKQDKSVTRIYNRTLTSQTKHNLQLPTPFPS